MGEYQDSLTLERHTQASMLKELDRHKAALLKALEHGGGTHTWASLVDGLMEQQYQLWSSGRGAVVTELVEWPSGDRWCHIFILGGELDAVLWFETAIAEWAREHGCSRLTMTGRKGWRKVMRHWDEPMVSMQRMLT